MNKALVAMLPVLMASASWAQPMWLKNGAKSGQAYAIDLHEGCVAVTAAHLLKPAADRIRLTNEAGDAFFPTVLAQDDAKGIAVLYLGKPDGRSQCKSPGLISIGRLGEYEPDVVGLPGVWFDMIAGPTGGLDRFDVALPKKLPGPAATEFIVTAKAAPEPNPPTDKEGRPHSGSRNEAPAGRFKRLPTQDNSGAALWMGNRLSGHFTFGRYDGDRLVADWSTSLMAGMLLRVTGERAYVMTTPAIIDFIGQALRPIDPAKLVIDPSGATISDQGRGQFIGVTRSWGSSMLTDYSVEFDLGDEGAEFNGFTVVQDVMADPDHRYDPHPSFRFPSHSSGAILINVSQSRPREGRDWRSVNCKGEKWEPTTRFSAVEQVRMNCELDRPAVARGVRITLRGVPGRWREIKLNLAR